MLINILASETNFGYGHGAGWRILKKCNSVDVKNLPHLYLLYHNACKVVLPEAEAVLQAQASGKAAIAAAEGSIFQGQKTMSAAAADVAKAAAENATAISEARSETNSPETKTGAASEEGCGAAENDRFLVFEFDNESRIVLETLDCMLSESEILAQHGIPAAASAGIRREALQMAEQQSGQVSSHTEEKPGDEHEDSNEK